MEDGLTTAQSTPQHANSSNADCAHLHFSSNSQREYFTAISNFSTFQLRFSEDKRNCCGASAPKLGRHCQRHTAAPTNARLAAPSTRTSSSTPHLFIRNHGSQCKISMDVASWSHKSGTKLGLNPPASRWKEAENDRIHHRFFSPNYVSWLCVSVQEGSSRL